MKKTTFTLHDISKEVILSADAYLRTVIINKRRHYIRRITKLSRHGIVMLKLKKMDCCLLY